MLACACGSSGATGDAGADGSFGGDANVGDAGDAGDAKVDAGSIWSPSSAEPVHFHWQLSDTFGAADLLPNQQGPAVYDIDGEHATANDVAAIHAAGAKAVCYVDVGSLEQGRSDYASFPSAVIGPVMQGWPNENWLLVSAANQGVILPLMKARFESWCQGKGFDAIEPDNLDAFANIPTLVTQADNLTYDLAIASLAHGLSLSIGLKNLLPDVGASDAANLVATFDWALVEQCFQYTECTVYTQAGGFVTSGKAVFDVEYNQAPDCAVANQARFNAQLRDLNLVAPTTSGYVYTPCVPDSQSTW